MTTAAEDKLLKKLASRIEYLRRQTGDSQIVFAEKAGLHRAYFGDIERGRNISVLTASKIAKALGITLSELFQL